MNINNIINAVVIVGITGLFFGCVLAFASIVFNVKKDEREEEILKNLPGANCGACGYAGCSAYAAAIVNDNAPVNSCPVGKDAVANKIAEIMGVKSEAVEAKVAKVMCGGDCEKAKDKYIYHGNSDCISAARLGGGPKECTYGCLGLGTCVKECPFEAIEIVNGIAVVIEEKCQACGVCVSKCPKNIIQLVPALKKVYVNCSNKDKGALANKVCTSACIGCKICEKECPTNAITVQNNCAVIDYSLCTDCGLCAQKCPKKAIFVTEA